MMFFRKSVIIFCLAFVCFKAKSQQKDSAYKLTDVTDKDFNVTSEIVDKDAAAVIMFESGETHFAGNNFGWFDYVYTCKRRIRIINKNAFNLATVTVHLFTNNGRPEILSNIKATTYNLSNNVVTAAKLDTSDIFSEQENATHIINKFTLPSLQEGCIIEYSYTITSPYAFNMPSWDFQRTDYPVLWSEYSVSIPSALAYELTRHGLDSFSIQKSWDGKGSYNVVSNGDPLLVTSNTVNYYWAEKNVKPLTPENYISSLSNYIDKIEFQLAATYNGEDKSQVINTWPALSSYFLKQRDFQEALTEDNEWIKDLDNFKTKEPELDVAKDIYYYIQSNYTCTDASDVNGSMDLYDVYRKHKGNVRNINLLLVAMLRHKGIYAEPVMLSTKENGFINPSYPVLDKINYLICHTLIGGKSYLLDATNSVLGFGQLDEKCYNGYARVIKDYPDSLFLSSDILKDVTVSTLTISNDNGKSSGTYKSQIGDVESAIIRKKMITENTADYFKDLKKDIESEADISNTEIDSLSEKEMPLLVQYNINFKLNDDIVYFKPVISKDALRENPFKASERMLPVEMPYCTDKSYILNMDVPAGYAVDELPKSARISLNESDGSFQYLIQQTGDHIQLVCHLKINKTTFYPEDYETLRNFYAFVVAKEGEQIVFKKL